jgi:hypothetical protein
LAAELGNKPPKRRGRQESLCAFMVFAQNIYKAFKGKLTYDYSE